MDDFIFSDDPRQQAGGVFDPSQGAASQTDLKDSDPFGMSSGPSFVADSRVLDPFQDEQGKVPVDEELSEEEMSRIQAAARDYELLMQRLYEKESEERSLKASRQEDARLTLEKWKEEKRRQTEQRKALNKEQEVAFLEARKSYKAGNPWKNVCSMVDFKEKSDSRDVSRIRSVLIAKKNDA